MNCLVLVDIQNDFVPGGALAVPQGDRIVPIVNRLLPSFDLVVATQDWHPITHGSFAVNHSGHQPGDRIDLHGLPQILWPTHCVQGTPGAEFVPGLDPERCNQIFVKGMDPTVDSYSGFYDNGRRQATGLGDYLQGKGVTDVYVAGLATDYCVKFTVLDALQLGFNTYLIEDACRGVNLQAGDVTHAVQDMRAAGAQVITSEETLKHLGAAH
ncbi:Nicotinamidase [Chthoniobacter flavus Ellin428]|uniref:Nicotinamidase n=1 Tax=Chthoniobacter flavus Ellin428 TaxID=497964 RepID=B4CZ87_9BACT|nr:bifunctional nicotinamidase/pyrazinamidase [Chthoniobacter flavus]EDY20778.1 Nicotinamidase [Chthoniobacter flavus Ellin428]TCO89672.1 nicotinamidase/pyrazinamidase [Chthoniobacter flavus]